MQTLEQYVVANGPLRKGAFGDVVFAMQSRLSLAGFSLKPDSDFGGITAAALKDFQTRNGITDVASFGVLGPWTAKLLDRIPGEVTIPLPDELIYWFFMYGLGNESTSAGIDQLAAILRAASNSYVIAPTLSWSQRDQVITKIKKLPVSAKIMLAANSMGANAIPMVTNECPDHTFLYVAGYDPTIWWLCPAFQGRNVKHVRLFHGVNWLNPIGHARYTEAFAGQIKETSTGTTHVAIDDDIGLHKITKDDARGYALAA